MFAPSLPLTEKLVQCLQMLCALPTSVGQIDDLRLAAASIAAQLQSISGMQVHTLQTAGAPVVVARRAGRTQHTLLLYHRYDAAAPGPWRDWSHEPFQLTERDGSLYARGVADGKGALAAHIEAIRAIIEADGDLPCGIVLVAEGHGLQGSRYLAETVAAHPELFLADGCLGSQGERDIAGIPLCYNGVKGQLQVRLRAAGSSHPLSAGMAPSMRNPLWRITWALSSIKGADEDIQIAGFYDAVEGPSRDDNIRLRQILLDEAGRLQAWKSQEFLFGMSGAALVRAESTLPTCNLSAIECEMPGELAVIPAAASAVLDFQLVPSQQPQAIFDLLKKHLEEQDFGDIQLEILPDGYAPSRTSTEAPFIQFAMASGTLVHGAPLRLVPAGPFTLPLHIFTHPAAIPATTIGLSRPDSSTYGPDEHIPLDDLLRHAQLLIELLAGFTGAISSEPEKRI